jgi:hypothetical protein
VTIRLAPGLPSLRGKQAFACWREAVRVAKKKGLGVVHFALLGNHVHLIVEPRARPGEPGSGSPEVLTRGMQSLLVSLARRLNRALQRRGPVYADRYHVHVLRTPTEVRRALANVLANESLHEARSQREGEPDSRAGAPAEAKETGARGARALGARLPTPSSRGAKQKPITLKRDPFSSAWAFQEWEALWRGRVDWEVTNWSEASVMARLSEMLVPARTWLLREGWKRGR